MSGISLEAQIERKTERETYTREVETETLPN